MIGQGRADQGLLAKQFDPVVVFDMGVQRAASVIPFQAGKRLSPKIVADQVDRPSIHAAQGIHLKDRGAGGNPACAEKALVSRQHPAANNFS